VECAGATSSVWGSLGDDNDSFKFTSPGASLTVEVDGGQGDDVITVTGGRPVIDGSYNEDVIAVADNYAATIYGGPGHLDKITTGPILGSSTASNRIYPGPSNLGDMVYDGSDVVNGGPERDHVYSSNGNGSGDVVDGGGGFDTRDYSYYANAPVVVSTDDNAANDGVCSAALGGHQDNIHSDVERIIGTDIGNQACRSPAYPDIMKFGDIIFGSAVNNTLTGGGGSDYVHGRGGDDTLTGSEAVGGTDRDHITGYIIRAEDNFADRSITCQGSGRAYLDASDPAPTGGDCRVYREGSAVNAAVSLAIDELALNGLAGGFGL
jgi:Ca2+-binding RTX toxin-like protein